MDERRQRALTRYYLASGAGGIAVGVHTTQFEIHDPTVGLYRPVLEIAAATLDERHGADSRQVVRVAGVVGPTGQVLREARIASDLGFHLALVSFAGMRTAKLEALLDRARAVAEVMPILGFYLQPAVGGVPLPYEFWRKLCEIENLAGIKVAPFDRYRTLDVLRAVCDSGRAGEIAMYTGNDDNIVADLLTTYSSEGHATGFVGGLLGHWAVWTGPACRYRRLCLEHVRSGVGSADSLLRLNAEVTDANAAFFDAGNRFDGCIPGIHEVLRRQGLMQGVWCLDERLGLSPGQSEEIDRVIAAYPHLSDDEFVTEHLDSWLS